MGLDEFLDREMVPSPPIGEIVTRRFIVEVTSRYTDTHSAIASKLQQEFPSADWPFTGTVYNEDGSLAVAFPIVCREGNTSTDPDDPCVSCPAACDPVGTGCAAPRPTEPRFRIIEMRPGREI